MRITILSASLITITIAITGALGAQKHQLHTFQKRELTKKFYSEGATFGDFNNDRQMDIVSGPYWYEGPDFKKRHQIYTPKRFNIQRYSDNFFAFVYDFDRDGWQDVLFVGFPGKDASWFHNPGKSGERWTRHKVFDGVDNESPTFQDLDGDDKPELICQHQDRMGWAAPDWSNPQKPWKFHPISKKGIGGRFTHGLGVGDINGDGRNDILWRHGWWEQPESPDGAWKRRLFNFAGRGGAQMYVYDIDGDGDGDVISSHNAHGYGLYWFEQVQKDGKISFNKHRIMGEKPAHSRYRVVFGNLHALDLVDMDGDGLKDIVTGNRYWAHGGRDKADRDKAPVYWFKLVRAATGTGAGAGAHFIPHQIDDHSGVGTQVVAGDVNGDGQVDVVVGNKMGTFVHLHKSRRVSEVEWLRARRKAMTAAIERASGAKIDRTGPVPVGAGGKKLNLDFETGDLTDWTATGTAFEKQPVKGDTVHPRRNDSRSMHAGNYWIGTYEPNRSDRATGTLTSAKFKVTHPFCSLLVGGGRSNRTRVELVLASNNEVLDKVRGQNRENMRPVSFDLRKHQGKEIFIRLVDDDTGGWGHINFDDFRFHAKDPWPETKATDSEKNTSRNRNQTEGYLPAAAARRMSVPKGFQVDLVAGEPDLHQPIAFTMDERGRLWVAEAHSYPKRKPDGKGTDKILVFEDTTGDGSYDKRTVFVQNLNLVSGLEVGFGGVWVGAAPYFMFIPDRDGDLVPDGKPKILLDGWGYQDTHETLNAFNWGPDGWLYGCHGVFTHSKVGRPGTPDDKRIKLNAAVWRYHPTRHQFEVFAWGASNQWGVDFDDQGQAFITACVIPHLYHVIQGGRYQRQSGKHFNRYVYDDIKTIADHLHYLGAKPHSGNGISNSVGGGHAHCGAMIYLGDTFPKEYRGKIFMSNIHGNRINTDVLHRQGSGFVGSHGDDFLLANDQWFRGINLRYGPNGNVYLIDWYDEQACHLRRPEVWDRTNGRLYRVSYGKPRTQLHDLARLTNKELVALQLHENDWQVRVARRLLQQRGGNPEVHRDLVAILRADADITRKLRALWALHVTDGLSEDLALQQLRSPHEYLRAWTIQLLLEDKKASKVVRDRLAELARKDPSPVVRLYLASALQRLPLDQRWPIAEALVTHGEDQSDHNLPLMVWYGIEPLVNTDATRALELANSSKLSKVSRFIFRRMASGKNAHLDSLVSAVAATGSVRRRQLILGEMLVPLRSRKSAPMPKAWPKVYAKLKDPKNPKLREQALTLAVIFGDTGVHAEIQDILADRSRSKQKRQWALDTLLRAKNKSLEPALRNLLDDPMMCASAIRALSSYSDPKTASLLLARYPKLRQTEQREAVRTLTTRAPYTKALLGAILAKKVPASVLDSATTRRQIGQLKDKDVDKLMEAAWGRSIATTKDKKDLIKKYKKKLPGGIIRMADLSHGRAVYAKTCMACHKMFGTGGTLGPDITGSNRRNLDYILNNIIDPSAEVAKEYMMTTVETKNGGFFAGLITDDTEESITVANQVEVKVLAKKDILRDAKGKLAITKSAMSLMPEGQLLALTDTEVRDLIGYLAADRQVPMAARAYNLPLFFDGENLQGWDADPAVWSVVNGELVGKTKGLKRNNFAQSHMLLSDFRLVVQVKLKDNQGNSGIQFRSKAIQGGGMKGYQADIGKGWWGKLYDEHGRGLLWKKPGDAHVKLGDWNTYEILAIGHRIRTAINGKLCVDLEDKQGATQGILGLQVHSGGAMEVRFKGFELELDPKPVMKTVK